jgi:hypothetical protein
MTQLVHVHVYMFYLTMCMCMVLNWQQKVVAKFSPDHAMLSTAVGGECVAKLGTLLAVHLPSMTIVVLWFVQCRCSSLQPR